MTYDSDIHHRRTIRLQEYDYSAEGLYFITICTHEQQPLFGEIVEDEMRMNELGKIIEEQYHQLAQKYPNIVCWEYVVMPNHFHCIIQITNDEMNTSTVGVPLAGTRTHKVMPVDSSVNVSRHPQGMPLRRTLGEIIGAFKSITTNECLRLYKQQRKTMDKLWQRNYYEHIIRNQRSYEEISTYILENPRRWGDDSLHIHR